MEETEIVATKLKANLEKLIPLVEFLRQRITSWENYLQILESKELLQRFNRRWNAYAKAKELGFILAQNVERFKEEMSKAIIYIKTNNPRLGEKISKFKPVPENTRPQLATLLTILNQNKTTAISYIKTHSHELMAWAETLENLDLSKAIRRLVIDISGEEITELSKCINDLQRWKSFRIGNDVQFFYNRVIVYLRGGTLEKENFFGLVRYFKDKSFIDEIRQSNAIKMLLTYKRQLNFFKNARNVVAYSIQNPGWEGFRGHNGFYNNITKGKNYVKMVKEDFGNKEIADLMDNAYETTGEYPEGWLKNIDSILARIKHPTYQNTYVIVPAANDLLGIFEKKLRELLGESIESKLDRLKNIVKRNFEASIKESRNLGIFESILSGERRILEKETAEEKRNLKNLLFTSGQIVINFVEGANEVLGSDYEVMHKKIAAFLKLKMSELNVLKRMRGSKRLSDDPRFAVSVYSSMLKNNTRLNEIDRWVELVKLSGINALKFSSDGIEVAIKREIELRKATTLIDNDLSRVKGFYFVLRKNDKDVTIMNPEYLDNESIIREQT